ncbi:hypothetical protein A9Q76_03295 [Arcobacter sp. 31_11_sub10_T18]|nr:hypothetical protein A9Q76_03295 [Arcobacter sp. 31_11_sub10_T18]
MDKKELQEARTNPDFLKYLEQTRKDAIELKNISAMYEVLDSYLILDLQEDKINDLYENILKVAFEKIEVLVGENKKLTLEGDELFYIRSFYEHSIEKWSYESYDGAKELLFILTQIVDDEKLMLALNMHLVMCSKQINLDDFYDKYVDNDASNDNEKYGYFIVNYKIDVEKFLKENKDVLDVEYENLKHLMN